jgi:hypothetical protein
MEQELNPEFIKELIETQKEKTVKVKDFNYHYNHL